MHFVRRSMIFEIFAKPEHIYVTIVNKKFFKKKSISEPIARKFIKK